MKRFNLVCNLITHDILTLANFIAALIFIKHELIKYILIKIMQK